MKKRSVISFSIYFFFLFAVSLSVQSLTKNGNLVWTVSSVLKVSSLSLVGGILLGLLAGKMSSIRFEQFFVGRTSTSFCKFYFISFASLSLIWSLYFAAYYPGILGYDSYIQVNQIMNAAYNNHHPIIHTLLIKLFFDVAKLLGCELGTGAMMYVLFQLFSLAAVISYGIALLAKNVSKTFAIVIMMYFAIQPEFGFLSISMTKDVFFGEFVLLFFLSIVKLLFIDEKEKKYSNYIMLGISALFVTVFRNNGKYALAFSIVFFLIALVIKGTEKKKTISKIVIISTVCMIIGMGFLKLADKKLNVTPGDKREMLSIPIQQLARTYMYHGGAGLVSEDDNTLLEEEKALLDEFMLYDSYKLYRMDISDPVKSNTNTYVVRYKTAEFAKVYLRLLKRYPGDFINAFLGVNAGFLSPFDETHATINQKIIQKRHGYIQTSWECETYNGLGIYEDSKLQGFRSVMDQFADSNGYLNIPILKYILMPGIYLWLLLYFIVLWIVKKEYEKILTVSFLLGYYGTCLLGPTVQLRYVFPVMIVIPFIGLVCSPNNK